MAHRRNPLPVGDALAQFTQKVQPTSVLAEVQRRWPEAVGETIAGWTTPVSENAGIVLVECDDSVVAHELEMMKTEILRKLTESVKTAPPADLKFRVK